MFTAADIQRIKKLAAETLKVQLCAADVQQGAGMHLIYQDGQANIVAEDRSALARACFLLAAAIRDGKKSLELHQHRHIASCGPMIDVSRNAVLTVPAVKRLLDKMALLGMNLLMLYTEDTYEVENTPYFGYLRGRYTQDELREIDRYAESLDIELVPCIQTLGHMAQYLQWNVTAPLRDQNDILLIDHPETYALIEKMIAGLRSCMRAKRIHVGMDEAHGVGLGQYYAKHGPTDRFELLNRHLAKVNDLCKKYDFHPMMWSDMFFRLGSANNDYYDINSCIPEPVVKMIPDVDLVYWDYYHKDQNFYDHMLEEHAKLGKTAFAGGIWTWSGFLPHVKKTRATMGPALRSCAAHGVHTVLATMWGDDGAETNISLALSQLPIFSEACWQGTEVEDSELDRLGELLTGIPAAVYQTFGEFYPSDEDFRPGKGLIWCDLLYPLMENDQEPLKLTAERFRQAEKVMDSCPDLLEAEYAGLCFRIAVQKAEIIAEIRERYLAGDMNYLRRVAEEQIPSLLQDYACLRNCHRSLWERDNKRNGWEVLALRYGAVCGRLEDVRYALNRYLENELSSLAELEEEPLPADRRFYQFYAAYVSPSVIQ